MDINIQLPKKQIIDLEQHKYAIVDLVEYEKMETFIKEYLENVEDIRLIDEARAKSKKSYTLDEITKEYNIDLDKVELEDEYK